MIGTNQILSGWREGRVERFIERVVAARACQLLILAFSRCRCISRVVHFFGRHLFAPLDQTAHNERQTLDGFNLIKYHNIQLNIFNEVNEREGTTLAPGSHSLSRK